MLKQILLLIGVIFLVTGCNMELKRSANNKLFDTKGFDGGKRRPVYNNKYIDRAKRNVIENNYDDEDTDIDEPDEYVDPYTQNRLMYSNMIKKDKNKKGRKNPSKQQEYDQSYPDIGHAKDIALSHNNPTQANDNLRNELAEIKTMLSAAKKDLVKYKCPLQEAQKNPKANTAPFTKKPVHSKPKQEIPHEEAVENMSYDEPVASGHDELQNPIQHSDHMPTTVAPAPVQQVPVAPQAPVNVAPQNIPVQTHPAPQSQPNNAKAHYDPHDDEIIDELPNSANHTPAAPVNTVSTGTHTMINLAPK